MLMIVLMLNPWPNAIIQKITWHFGSSHIHKLNSLVIFIGLTNCIIKPKLNELLRIITGAVECIEKHSYTVIDLCAKYKCLVTRVHKLKQIRKLGAFKTMSQGSYGELSVGSFIWVPNVNKMAISESKWFTDKFLAWPSCKVAMSPPTETWGGSIPQQHDPINVKSSLKLAPHWKIKWKLSWFNAHNISGLFKCSGLINIIDHSPSAISSCSFFPLSLAAMTMSVFKAKPLNPHNPTSYTYA